MHKEQINYCLSIKNKYPELFKGKILDCGSLDINGNNRYLFEDTSEGDEPAINYFKKLIDDVNFYGFKVDRKVDRRESLLLKNEVCRKDIESILFLNSIVIIKKR